MSKLTTEACIAALCEQIKSVNEADTDNINPKNWKRISKTGNSKDGYTRRFENKVTGILLDVKSSDTEISEINMVSTTPPTPVIQLVSPVTGGLIKICQKIYDENQEEFTEVKDDDPDGNHLVSFLLPELDFDRLPQRPDPMGGAGTEDLDFENSQILSLNDSTIKIVAHGDWQEPMIFSATMVNGVLTYKNDAIEGYLDGLSDEEILAIIQRPIIQ